MTDKEYENEILRRVRNAVKVLKEGGSFRVDNITLTMNDNQELAVTGWMDTYDFSQIRMSEVITKLEETRRFFDWLVGRSEDLGNFLANKRTLFSILYDDGTKGGIDLYQVRDGKEIWKADSLL